jgi:transcriptional regulator with PAS, ATPase and Fis domain
MLRSVLSRRGLLFFIGFCVCVNAIAVVVYVQTIPDVGLRTAFSTDIKTSPREGSFYPVDPKRTPKGGDQVVWLGDAPIHTWPELLARPRQLRERLWDPSLPFPHQWAKRLSRDDEDVLLVKVIFERSSPDGQSETIEGYCQLDRLPLEEMIPTVLWFFLKATLFGVGALVLWKRPRDAAAETFFLLCIVTLGAYLGGYHWAYIATQPVLLLVFMVSAVLLPVVSLHFYLVFPRPKQFLRDHPLRTLVLVYGLPVICLVVMIIHYGQARWLVVQEADTATVLEALDRLRLVIYVYLGIAGIMYLFSIAALLHSFWTVTDRTEHNQVKWILCGAILALLPIGYSLYLAFWDRDAFGAGAATWPMFAASVCLTVAFAVSITRYRLMELDQILTSGVAYFSISFLAGLLYYAVLFVGTLLFNQVMDSTTLTQALIVSTTALVLMLALDIIRSRLRRALDQRFSRDKYQLDRTLQRMGQAIAQLVDPPMLAQRLLQTSSELLAVARGAVYLRQEEPSVFRLAGSLGAAPLQTELLPDSPLVQFLQQEEVVLAPPPRSHAISAAQLQLQALGGAIAHAVSHEKRLLAVMILGPKDHSPYRPDDLNLLGAFAQITVPALESAQGHQKIELLNHELKAKVEKISEQQRRILSLERLLRKQAFVLRPAVEGRGTNPANGSHATITAPSAEQSATERNPSTADKNLLNTSGIIGSSPAVRQLLHLVQKVASNDKTVVLIRGDSGTGKELLAQALHEASPRAGKAFVKVHCAALSPSLLESELFGHVKGAFTGAHRDKMGRFESANGGTLFLDEIGDISLEVQTKLLRVLQERTFERVGASEPIVVDVRIVAATHQDLERLIQQGRFREDLYYRLNVFPIVVPPLRQRWQDIPELVSYFLAQSAQRCNKAVPQIDDDVLAMLKAYSWPGNIRQLENVIERAVVITEGGTLTVSELPDDLVRAVELAPAWTTEDGHTVLEPFNGLRRDRAERDRRERDELVRALSAASGNRAEAARALGLARSTLVSRLKKHGLLR